MRALLLLLFLTFACFARGEDYSVRSMKLRVTDAKTGDAIEGISVYYALRTIVVQKYFLLFIPSLEPDIGPKITFKQHQFTDENGEVIFENSEFSLPHNERLDRELIFINLDVDMKRPRARSIQDSLQRYYTSGRVRREGPVDAVDVLEKMVCESVSERVKSLVLPNPDYKGILLVSVAFAQVEGYRDWTQKDDKSRVEYNFESLSNKGSDFISVELEHYGNSGSSRLE